MRKTIILPESIKKRQIDCGIREIREIRQKVNLYFLPVEVSKKVPAKPDTFL
jgi:hypothetical protein